MVTALEGLEFILGAMKITEVNCDVICISNMFLRLLLILEFSEAVV